MDYVFIEDTILSNTTIKKQGVPRIAFRFRHGFRLRLLTATFNWETYNDRRYSHMNICLTISVFY